MKPDIKALGLCSGGLDSMLAGLVLREQNIATEWITFESPFFAADKARKASRITGIPLTVENITPTYLKMLRKPPCGYGKYMNPCMDCHALMFRLAGDVMTQRGFHFLFSGEVVGQRPMSQTRPSLRYVEKHSGFDGYVVRPLSGRLLPETIPEQKGWLDRSKLLDFSGRSRKPQMALARHYGITEYPTPAGGCLLTDAGFSARLKDLFAHQSEYREHELHLLKYGRHLRLNPETKLIVGRTKGDNAQIFKFHDPENDILLKTPDVPGPLVLLAGKAGEDVVHQAAAICVGYGKTPTGEKANVRVDSPQRQYYLEVAGRKPVEVQKYLVSP